MATSMEWTKTEGRRFRVGAWAGGDRGRGGVRGIDSLRQQTKARDEGRNMNTTNKIEFRYMKLSCQTSNVKPLRVRIQKGRIDVYGGRLFEHHTLDKGTYGPHVVQERCRSMGQLARPCLLSPSICRHNRKGKPCRVVNVDVFASRPDL